MILSKPNVGGHSLRQVFYPPAVRHRAGVVEGDRRLSQMSPVVILAPFALLSLWQTDYRFRASGPDHVSWRSVRPVASSSQAYRPLIGV